MTDCIFVKEPRTREIKHMSHLSIHYSIRKNTAPTIYNWIFGNLNYLVSLDAIKIPPLRHV